MKNQTVKKIRELAPVCAFKQALYIALVSMQAALTVVFALCVKSLVNAVEYSYSIKSAVIWLIVTVVALCLLGALSSFLGDSLTTNTEKNLKARVYRGLFLSGYDSVTSFSQGDLLSRFDGDVSVVSGVRVNLLPSIIATAVRLIGTLVAMLYLDVKFTLVVLACAVVVVVASVFIRKVISKLHKGVRNKSADNYTFIQESLNLAPVVKAFGHESYLLDRAVSTFNGYKSARLKQRYFSSFISVLVNVLFTGFYVVVAIYGVLGINSGNTAISFGLITAMLQLVLQIKSPITGISRFFSAYAEMLTSGERLLEVSGKAEEVTSASDFTSLKLENVSFSYGENEVLSGVNLTVNKGDKVLIKGASGAGKSTLIRVILNLYSNYSGKVILTASGKEIQGKTSGVFAFVPQDSKTLTASIKENVILGAEFNEERFNFALETSHLKEVVNSLENKEETILNTQTALSEGQAQRLSVARALYSGAPVIVLDEPTSHLDGVSEEALFSSLCGLKDLTVIMVSHKKESEKHATAIYTLENKALN